MSALSSTLLLLVLASSAHAAAPVAWSATVTALVDDAQAASKASAMVQVPELQGDGLTITIANYNGVEYKACLKIDAASPVAAGMKNWDNVNHCELFHFTNATATTAQASFSAARLRAVPSNLRGVGSVANALAADVAGAVQLQQQQRRRAVPGAKVRGTDTRNVRAGNYFITIAAVATQKTNATLTLNLSGTKCANAGEYGLTCQAAAAASAGKSVTVSNIAANGLALVQFQDFAQINASTGAATVAVEVDTVDGSVALLARWGAAPTADVFDAKLPVTAANKIVSATIASPRAARWYFGVLNNSNKTAVTANMTVSLTQCKEGQFGAACNTNVTAVATPGATVDNEEVKKGAMFYYKFHRNATALTRSLLAANPAVLAFAAAQLADPNANATAPSVYARAGTLPTTSDFDYVDCTVATCTDDQNTLIVPADDVSPALENQDWYVLVVANADGSVYAWNAAGGACANNCGAHGKCDTANALCQCEEDYAAFDCAEKKSALERWEWALIIGGAVLVAIGLIGCIVYFIQRQSRRAGFERV